MIHNVVVPCKKILGHILRNANDIKWIWFLFHNESKKWLEMSKHIFEYFWGFLSNRIVDWSNFKQWFCYVFSLPLVDVGTNFVDNNPGPVCFVDFSWVWDGWNVEIVLFSLVVLSCRDRFAAVSLWNAFNEYLFLTLAVNTISSGRISFRHEVGLCVASLLNKRFTLLQRAEAALAGFICLDLFRLLAAEKCHKKHVPAGSCFMASQTVANLQSCSLSALVMCLTKTSTFEPWKFGQCRLSELSVEQFFGQRRSQSSNAQLTTRGFFHSSARTCMRSAKKMTKTSHEITPGDGPLTDQEFLAKSFGSVSL